MNLRVGRGAIEMMVDYVFYWCLVCGSASPNEAFGFGKGTKENAIKRLDRRLSE